MARALKLPRGVVKYGMNQVECYRYLLLWMDGYGTHQGGPPPLLCRGWLLQALWQIFATNSGRPRTAWPRIAGGKMLLTVVRSLREQRRRPRPDVCARLNSALRNVSLAHATQSAKNSPASMYLGVLTTSTSPPRRSISSMTHVAAGKLCLPTLLRTWSAVYVRMQHIHASRPGGRIRELKTITMDSSTRQVQS